LPIIERHPRLALSLTTALLAAFFITLKVQQFRNFDVRDFDTGIYSNIAWNVATGDGFWSDVLGRHALGEHFSPIVAVFSPLYWIWPSALVLLIAQAIAVAVAFPLLAAVAKHVFRDLKPSMSVPLVIALLGMAFFYRPVFSALECEFHPCTLGMPLVATGFLVLHLNRPAWLIPIVLALLCTKEMAGLSVIGLGLYACFVLRRPRLAASLFLTGIASGLIIMLVIIPYFRGEAWTHQNRFGPLVDVDVKLLYLLKLAAGLGFLSLFGWRALLAAAPLTMLNLLVSMPNQYSLDFHYDDQNSIFWLVAAAHGMNALAHRWLNRSEHKPVWLTCAAIVCVATLVLVSSKMKPWKELRHQCIKPPAKVAELRAALSSFAQLPKEVGIAATAQLGPHVNLRDRYRRVTNINVEVLADDLKPGDLVLISPVRLPDGLDFARIKQRLRRSNAFTLQSEKPLIEAYRRVTPGERN